MNSREFAKALRKNTAFAKIPTVVVSAFTEKAAELQVNEVIQKPIDLDQLLKIVKRYCG